MIFQESAARIHFNFDQQPECQATDARIAASGANYIIDDSQSFPKLEAAMADLNWLAATTARQRDLRKPVMTPLEVVVEMRTRMARGERCGILFGRERNGLETDEVAMRMNNERRFRTMVWRL